MGDKSLLITGAVAELSKRGKQIVVNKQSTNQGCSYTGSFHAKHKYFTHVGILKIFHSY